MTGVGTSIKALASMVEEILERKCNNLSGSIPYREQDIMYAAAPISKNRDVIHWKANIITKQGLSVLLHNSQKPLIFNSQFSIKNVA